MSETLEQIALRVAEESGAVFMPFNGMPDGIGFTSPKHFVSCIERIVADLGAQGPVAIPWQDVVAAIRAVGDEAWKRGLMFPQVREEHEEDRKAERRICEQIEWYAKHGGAVAERLPAWPKAYAAPQLPQQQHSELLKIHTILMCPAECPPVSDNDTLTVKMLKEIIHAWHKQIPTHEGQQRIFEELDLLVTLLKGWPTSIATSEGFRAVRSIRKSLLAAAPQLPQREGWQWVPVAWATELKDGEIGFWPTREEACSYCEDGVFPTPLYAAPKPEDTP